MERRLTTNIGEIPSGLARRDFSNKDLIIKKTLKAPFYEPRPLEDYRVEEIKRYRSQLTADKLKDEEFLDDKIEVMRHKKKVEEKIRREQMARVKFKQARNAALFSRFEEDTLEVPQDALDAAIVHYAGK